MLCSALSLSLFVSTHSSYTHSLRCSVARSLLPNSLFCEERGCNTLRATQCVPRFFHNQRWCSVAGLRSTDLHYLVCLCYAGGGITFAFFVSFALDLSPISHSTPDISVLSFFLLFSHRPLISGRSLSLSHLLSFSVVRCSFRLLLRACSALHSLGSGLSSDPLRSVRSRSAFALAY